MAEFFCGFERKSRALYHVYHRLVTLECKEQMLSSIALRASRPAAAAASNLPVANVALVKDRPFGTMTLYGINFEIAGGKLPAQFCWCLMAIHTNSKGMCSTLRVDQLQMRKLTCAWDQVNH